MLMETYTLFQMGYFLFIPQPQQVPGWDYHLSQGPSRSLLGFFFPQNFQSSNSSFTLAPEDRSNQVISFEPQLKCDFKVMGWIFRGVSYIGAEGSSKVRVQKYVEENCVFGVNHLLSWLFRKPLSIWTNNFLKKQCYTLISHSSQLWIWISF